MSDTNPEIATESVNGWTPPMIYDISSDKYRIATQDDADTLVAVSQEYGRILREMRNTVAFSDARKQGGWK